MAQNGFLVCSPVMGETVEKMLSQIQLANECGADCVELRLDCLNGFNAASDLEKLLKGRVLRAIVTCRDYNGPDDDFKECKHFLNGGGVFSKVPSSLFVRWVTVDFAPALVKSVVLNSETTFTKPVHIFDLMAYIEPLSIEMDPVVDEVIEARGIKQFFKKFQGTEWEITNTFTRT
uniref:3-dehydroquinate dehydratase n=1 Tax=Araucaria cunninghamii TaxID=56994 RepID=A0A0D6QV43_ARACU